MGVKDYVKKKKEQFDKYVTEQKKTKTYHKAAKAQIKKRADAEYYVAKEKEDIEYARQQAAYERKKKYEKLTTKKKPMKFNVDGGLSGKSAFSNVGSSTGILGSSKVSVGGSAFGGGSSAFGKSNLFGSTKPIKEKVKKRKQKRKGRKTKKYKKKVVYYE